MTGDHLISRPACTQPCTACHRHILIAIDQGLTIHADPEPLTVPAEIAARLTGRGTYDITRTGGKTYLITRDIFRIRADREYPVVGGHACIPGHQPGNGWHPPPVRGHRPSLKIRQATSVTGEIPF
jgi:hypothetical protein